MKNHCLFVSDTELIIIKLSLNLTDIALSLQVPTNQVKKLKISVTRPLRIFIIISRIFTLTRHGLYPQSLEGYIRKYFQKKIKVKYIHVVHISTWVQGRQFQKFSDPWHLYVTNDRESVGFFERTSEHAAH